MSGTVDIGFLEECEKWKLTSKFFPSKVGGKPAWLALKSIPNGASLQCEKCGEPLAFLCQIYAPIESRDDCFHRTLFVFVCKSSKCYEENNNTNMKVFRCQLSRANSFYSFDPPIEVDDNILPENCLKLCKVCGCPGEKKCGKCLSVQYCTKSHQLIDWKAGHRDNCEKPFIIDYSDKFLFKEWEVVIEKELDESEETVDEEEQLQIFERLKTEGKVGSMQDVDEQDLLNYADMKEDKVFQKFRKKISSEPDQVVRYELGGTPLWITKKGQMKEDEIPVCQYCGSKRQFEFQILPQLIHLLKDDSLDWGILAIYTCKENCNNDTLYKEEFILKQDLSVESNV